MIRVSVSDVLSALDGEDPSADAVAVLGDKLRLLVELFREAEVRELRGSDLRLTDDETGRLHEVFGEHLGPTAEVKPHVILALLKAWDGRRPEPDENRDVHTEHCCRLHGCKYGDADCPVETGAKAQTSYCESCDFS